MTATHRGAQRQPDDFYETIPGRDGYRAGRDGRIYSTKGWQGIDLRLLSERHDRDGYASVLEVER